MTAVLVGCVAVLCWAVAATKLRVLSRSPRHPGVRSLTLALVSLGVALTLFVPAVYRGFDRLMGVPNLAELVGHSFVLLSAWNGRALLLYLTASGPETSRGERAGWTALAGTVGLLAVLFVTAPVDQEAPGTFTERYASLPLVAAYWLVFLIYLAATLADIARLCWRYARLSERTYLRLGLRLVSAGSLVGIAYFAHWGMLLLLGRLDGQLPVAVETLWRSLFAGAVVLLLVGATIPAWGHRANMTSLRSLLRRHRAHRVLYPLWSDLHKARPEIAFASPRSRLAEAVDFRDVRFRLYRRVIEIRDGRLALRPYMNPSVRVVAERRGRDAGLEGEDLDAVVEAARLAAALEAMRQHRSLPADQQTYEAPGGHDYTSDVAWLEKVALAYVSSPVVSRVVAEQRLRDPALVSGGPGTADHVTTG